MYLLKLEKTPTDSKIEVSTVSLSRSPEPAEKMGERIGTCRKTPEINQT
jgi:hypothetical protein